MSVSSPSGKIQPLFFNASDKQLFGAYHPPIGETTRRRGVVLCYPLGDEYVRSHRAFFQLAARLNRLGYPVLRFDYYGMGDSAGEDVDATFTRWQLDTSAAIDRMKTLANVDSVVLVGLRLGATIALSVAAQRSDVAGVVLWEPVIEGKAYLAELAEAHEHKMFYLASQPVPQQSSAPQAVEYLGFAFSAQMLSELDNINLLRFDKKLNGKALVIESSENQEMQALRQCLQEIGVSSEHQQVESPVIWAEDPDKALVPHALLQAVVGWIEKHFP